MDVGAAEAEDCFLAAHGWDGYIIVYYFGRGINLVKI